MASPEDEVSDDCHGVFPGASASPYLEQLLQGMASSAATPPQTDVFSPWFSGQPFSDWTPLQQPRGPQYGTPQTPNYDVLSHLAASLDNSANSGLLGNIHGYEDFTRRSPLGSTSDAGSEVGPFGGSPSGAFGGFPLDSDVSRGAAESGREMYTEAMQHWGRYYGPTYNPFGTSDVFQPAEDPVSRQTPSPSPPAVPPVHTKPSYCDVAKNKASRDATDKPPVPPAAHMRETTRVPDGKLPDFSGNHRVPYRKSRSTSRSQSKVKAGDAPEVLPDSKYGLDNFEDPSLLLKERVRRQHSSGSDSVPASRKGSTSSIGSGCSSLDEILAARGSPANQQDVTDIPSTKTSPSMQPRAQKLDKQHKTAKSESSTAKQSSSATQGKAKERKTATDKANTRPFFDPKRIFQKDKSSRSDIPNNQTCSQDSKDSTASGNTEPIFDPKRIFGKVKPDSSVPNNHHPGGQPKEGATLLNNGKVGSSYPCGGPGKPTSTHYIVNDLRQSKKHTNTDGKGHGGDKTCNNSSDRPSGQSHTGDKPEPSPVTERTTTVPKPVRRKADNLPRKAECRRMKQSRKAKEEHGDPLGELLGRVAVWCRWAGEQLGMLLWNVAMLVLKCALLLVMLLAGYVYDVGCSGWAYIRHNIFRIGRGHSGSDDSEPGGNKRYKPQGLKENIALPSTGEEAMRRLLACKGKDPYSILGVRMDASDEEIKKYYRKQAVLVHPDKNQQAGAEEAFKILGHAFELIGEPEKRLRYDAQRYEASETEAARQEFADLLSKLHEKIQEEANTMRCYNCGGKHRRVLKDRPAYSARYCDRCNTLHAAKEGDVWAETTMLGFLWHYYACMEGKIYDITEWASCQSSHFKHIQANSHQVIYRIATNGSRQRHPQREPDLEDFINHLFHHSPNPSPPHGASSADYFSSAGQPASGMGTSAWSGASQSRKKRKKKRH